MTTSWARNFSRTSSNIKKQLQRIGRRCAPGDTFVFFYSGHGINVKASTSEKVKAVKATTPSTCMVAAHWIILSRGGEATRDVNIIPRSG